MKAAIITPGRDIDAILKHLTLLDPDFHPEVWPDIEDPGQITAALIWRAPEENLKDFHNLKLICSFGAGVDHLLLNSSIPDSVSITKLVDPNLTNSVTKYCLMAIIAYEKNLDLHLSNKRLKEWQWKKDQPVSSIGVLGMGVIGKNIAITLRNHGYKVYGYSGSPKKLDGITHFNGTEKLPEFLKNSGILVNIMPLTKQTSGFYNLDLFRQCNPGTYFINLGRGQHVVEEDLLEAIGSGFISGATLDVFCEEPLPEKHPFWENKHIIITPHIAGLTLPSSAATQFYDNFKRLKDGLPLINEVDRSKGY